MKTLKYLFANRFDLPQSIVYVWPAIALNINLKWFLVSLALVGVVYYLFDVKKVFTLVNTYSIADLVAGLIFSFFMSRGGVTIGLWLILFVSWFLSLGLNHVIQQRLEDNDNSTEA